MHTVQFSSVQFSRSVMSDSLCPHKLQHARLPCPSSIPKAYSNSCALSQWCHPTNHLILCCPLLFPPSSFPSLRVFSNESALRIRWPKFWSFSFSISPSNDYSGLTFLRIDWLDLLAVQGTLKCLLQYHISKASILQCSAFFMIQFSPPYMTTGKTIDLTRWTFVGKHMSLLFKLLSRLVIAFLPRIKCLLTSWLQSPSAVILEHSKIKSLTLSIVSPFICHEVMGLDAMILVFWMLRFFFFFFNLNLFILFGGKLLYNIVLVLPHINMNPPRAYTCSPSCTPLPPPSLYHPSRSSQCTSPRDPVLNLDWWFIFYMILYMFPWHSPKSSHPLLLPLPQSPKDCSIHLCLFFCLIEF